MGRSSPPRKVQRTELVGKRMMKTFGGHGTFVGDIVSYDPETGCYQQVTYEDGDKEDLSRASVQARGDSGRPRQSDAIRLAEARFLRPPR